MSSLNQGIGGVSGSGKAAGHIFSHLALRLCPLEEQHRIWEPNLLEPWGIRLREIFFKLLDFLMWKLTLG